MKISMKYDETTCNVIRAISINRASRLFRYYFLALRES